MKIVAIEGSYRRGGVIDRLTDVTLQAARAAGAETEIVSLQQTPIGFCLNCRSCTQAPGDTPGKCVIDDAMPQLIRKLEEADAYLFASPTNFGTVTALFKRFEERLVPYAYWPWGAGGPRHRKARGPRKRAVLLASCAAPGLLGRFAFNTLSQLKMTAKTVGARPVGSMMLGLIAQDPHQALPPSAVKKARRLGQALARPSPDPKG